MFKKGQQVRIINPVQGTSQLLIGRRGKIVKAVHNSWWLVKLDRPFIVNHVPYRSTIFPQSQAAQYLEIA
jgi:hypothetical protein